MPADTGFVQPLGEFYGTLSAGVTALETSFQSALFSDTSGSTVLPTIGASTDAAVRLILADDVARTWECVYITAHSSGSATATVVRGREGTTALAWPAGTVIRSAPVPRDTVLPMNAAEMAAVVSPQIGMRVADRDTGRPRFRTKTQGFLAPAAAHPVSGVTHQGTATADMVPVLWGAVCNKTTVGGPSIGTVQQFATSMTWVDMPPMPGGVLYSVNATKSAIGSVSTFSAAHFAGVEMGAGNWRLWFVCVKYDGTLVGNALLCPFSVLALGA